MDTAQWLNGLPDELPVGNINLPGTHNSAAIDPGRRTLHACQNFSIGEQLRAGIRLLDVRLKVLGAVRGKIFLYNRLNDDPLLGVPVRWATDTAGSAAEYHGERAYEVWIQDRYNDFSPHPRRAKLRWIIAAFTKKTPENVVLNFASGTWFGVFGVYVMDELSQFLRAWRPGHFGWILFDYPFGLPGRSRSQPDVVATIIRSNF